MKFDRSLTILLMQGLGRNYVEDGGGLTNQCLTCSCSILVRSRKEELRVVEVIRNKGGHVIPPCISNVVKVRSKLVVP